MNSEHPEKQASQNIREAVARLRTQMPQLSNVLSAFEDLLAERAAFRAGLPLVQTDELTVDAAKFSQGVPVLDRESFTVPDALLKKAAHRLIPAMEKGLPGIASQLAVIRKALDDDERSPDSSGGLELSMANVETEAIAQRLGIDPQVLKFVVLQLIKPFAENSAAAIAKLLDGLTWSKGYCPVCGSWPELSFLEGTEGRRWLRCSFCAHHWPYIRTSCPFCETSDQTNIEIYFPSDRAWERAELCHQCKKYILSLDLRNMVEKPPLEVAVLGLVYLDVLAQEKGFNPGTITGWNALV